MSKVNIRKELASVDEFWLPKIIRQANGSLVKVAKGTGATN